MRKVRQKGRPARLLQARNCPVATSSSSVKGIITSMAAPASRHGAHQVPMTIGWMMMKVTLTTPRGTTRTAKKVTIQGMVRQRRRSPIAAIRPSIT